VRRLRIGWVLFAASLLLRAAHLLTILNAPFFTHLSLDPLAYDTWAVRIASGDWLGSGVFYQDPLYPYFLGLVYAVVGHHPAIAVALQIVLGSLVAPLVYAAALPWLGRAAALAGGCLAVAYAPSLYYDALVL
jgi:4-amino-4-deoxy-L-arabinose transferase-like glycosyltransferase